MEIWKKIGSWKKKNGVATGLSDLEVVFTGNSASRNPGTCPAPQFRMTSSSLPCYHLHSIPATVRSPSFSLWQPQPEVLSHQSFTPSGR